MCELVGAGGGFVMIHTYDPESFEIAIHGQSYGSVRRRTGGEFIHNDPRTADGGKEVVHLRFKDVTLI